MLSHDRVWAAIDALASRYGMTASGLARKAGLDATSFNKSKRTSPEGRDRWPSTESISKVLHATGASLGDFLQLVEPAPAAGTTALPLIATDRAADAAFSAEGRPTNAENWQRFGFPDISQEDAFALEVRGESLAPHYRNGDLLVVSPTAATRKGDRIVVGLKNGELLARELQRRTAKTLDVASAPGTGEEEQSLPLEDIAWVARVLWVRQ
jgi:phage repressor protein C with HTH and peptisase S24 domain